MGPPRNRSVNKRYSYGYETSPTKDGGSTSKKNQRKKLPDMLGPHWSKEELQLFYQGYRKHGRNWIKVAAVLRNRSVDMVDAVYSLNKAYLSLPEGTASVMGFIAMMTDYYSNMDDRDSEQERNDGVGPSRKLQTRMPRKVNETTSKGFWLHPEAVPTDYGCLPLLKKKRSAGSRPRVVGKRTPRFPVSHLNENVKKGLKVKENDEDVAHSIAMTLAEASKRGGSPQICQTPNRSDSMMSSPTHSAERMYDESEAASGWFVEDDDIEGCMEADNTELFRHKNENSSFDALETLASLSLMISPEANENGRKREKRDGRQVISRLEAAINKSQTSAYEAKEFHQLTTKDPRKRQKIMASRATHAAHASQLAKTGQHVSEMKPSNIRAKARNKRKMYKPKALEVSSLSDVVLDKLNVHLSSHSQRIDKLKGELSNCLSNQLMRRWCAFEWFYSAIDEPWFAKREFVEYLYHVGLGHVPTLTRVEWGVIRSSLGKPRRFSDQFLKEEKEKLNQFRDSVRTHTELRAGSRDGLSLDLGQHVLAIYPKTREIHNGAILTLDHDTCLVQFNHPELGTEIIRDTDCMPLYPYAVLPAALKHLKPIDKFFESLNEVKVNGLGKDRRLEKLENVDEVAFLKSEFQSRNGPRDTLSDHAAFSVSGTNFQTKETEVEAIAELTRALDKKESLVIELRRMNDDVLENQFVGDMALKDSDAFKKQYAAVLVQLNDANGQISSALCSSRERNTYQQNCDLNLPNAVGDLSDHGAISDHTANHTQESQHHVNEIVEVSCTKARTMVEIAIQALSSLKLNPTVEIDKAVDYMNDLLPLDDSNIPPVRPIPVTSGPIHSSLSLHQQLVSNVKAPDSNPMTSSVPSELITQCVATLFIIQKCTERQFPPAEVASILDSAVSTLQPCSAQNSQLYAEIKKCMGIIKNKILALVPT